MTSKLFLFLGVLVAWAATLQPVGANAYATAQGAHAKGLFFQQLKNPAACLNNGFVYTMELHRGSAPPTLVSSRVDFFNGDAIKIHIKPNITGYAYILLTQGSTGAQTVLFPHPSHPQDNFIEQGKEYVIPPNGLIRFDEHPGEEKLLFILSRKQIDAKAALALTISVSVDKVLADGPDAASGIWASKGEPGKPSSAATYVVKLDPSSIVCADVTLTHLAGGARTDTATAIPPGGTSSPISVSSPATGTRTDTVAAIPPAPTSVPTSVAAPATDSAAAPGTTSTLPVSGSATTAMVPGLAPAARLITDKWALVIGISKYRDSSLNLKAVRKDAVAFTDFLIHDAGFAPSHVITVYDKEATKEKILRTLEELGKKVRGDDLFVFYANGHGSSTSRKTGGNYFLCHDYESGEPVEKQLLMQDLSSTLKSQVPSERIVVILQSCHSGYAKIGAVPSAQSMSDELQGTGRIVATACQGYEASWVLSSGGVFTKALIPNLRRYPKLKEALSHTCEDVIARTERWKVSEQMHPVIKYDLWVGDDAVLMAKPSDPRP